MEKPTTEQLQGWNEHIDQQLKAVRAREDEFAGETFRGDVAECRTCLEYPDDLESLADVIAYLTMLRCAAGPEEIIHPSKDDAGALEFCAEIEGENDGEESDDYCDAGIAVLAADQQAIAREVSNWRG